MIKYILGPLVHRLLVWAETDAEELTSEEQAKAATTQLTRIGIILALWSFSPWLLIPAALIWAVFTAYQINRKELR